MHPRVSSALRISSAYARARFQSDRFLGIARGMTSLANSNQDVEHLLARVQALETDLRIANEKYNTLLARKSATLPARLFGLQDGHKAFDASRYSTRMIALKFAYLGRNYNGLEYAAGSITPQPTIEEMLWAALYKARLIFPTDEAAIEAGQISWAGCDYAKCGRTDKGVSAFGQVVSLRIRSNRPVPGRSMPDQENEDTAGSWRAVARFDPIKDELPYIQMLNKLLPPEIRVLAWCGDLPGDFNARFSCRERRYRYFFTNPGFAPIVGPPRTRREGATSGNPRREGWLDIQAMQDAAKRYEGLHDFRNLAKLDPSKQLTDFRRRIFHSEIRELDPAYQPAAYVSQTLFADVREQSENSEHSKSMSAPPKTYEFVLHGSAFLWHQVRHMVAVLFLVGQGLESPDIVDKLLDVQKYPTKPAYEMADDAPLVLWDCIFPDLDSENKNDSLKWIYAGDEASADGRPGKSKYGPTGLLSSLWSTWHRHKIDELLAGSLLNLAAGQGKVEEISALQKNSTGTKLFTGGDSSKHTGVYVPLMQRQRGEHFETMNAKYATKKGLVQKSEEQLLQLRSARRDKRHDFLDDTVA